MSIDLGFRLFYVRYIQSLALKHGKQICEVLADCVCVCQRLNKMRRDDIKDKADEIDVLILHDDSVYDSPTVQDHARTSASNIEDRRHNHETVVQRGQVKRLVSSCPQSAISCNTKPAFYP